MYCFISKQTNVYWNLALEEFLLKQSSEDFFFLWRSEASVVIGKHQNPYKEINIPFTLSKHINIARRLSGGGAVYQDSGNINFTIIKNTKEGKQIDLQQHSKPVFNALRSLGLDVNYSKRNDMLFDGKKFSGNAEHVNKNRVLHHGTILYETDLEILEKVLKSNDLVYQDKSIASVRSEVTNIGSLFTEKYSVTQFMELLLNTMVNQNGYMSMIESFGDDMMIEQLKKEKYETDDWVYSYTPKYVFEKSFLFNAKVCHINLKVVKGQIIFVKLKGIPREISNIIEKELINSKHLWRNIYKLNEKIPLEYYKILPFFI